MRSWLRFLGHAVLDEWKRMRREPGLLVALLAIPTVYPVLVGLLYERNQVVERPAVVVDQDNSSLSRELVRHLDATQEVRVVRSVDSLEDGWEAIRRQEVDLLVFVPRDFSQRVKKHEQGHVKLWINSANMLTYSAAYGAVASVTGQMNVELGKEFFLSKAMGSSAALQRTAPVDRVDRLLFHPTGAYGAFFVPGLLMVVIQQTVLIGMVFSAGLEREASGAAATVWPFTALAGKALAQLPFYLAGVVFVVAAVMPTLGWGGREHLAVSGLFALFSLSVIPLGMLVASLVRDRYAAFQVLMLVSAPVFLMSGFSWPLDQMPLVVRAVASALPSTPALLALRTLSMKTGSLAAIAPQLTWMAALAAAWTILSVVVVRRSWRRVGVRRPTCARA